MDEMVKMENQEAEQLNVLLERLRGTEV